MVIASGRTDRHVGAIADQLKKKIKDAGWTHVRVEGQQTCDWVLIDTGDIIVHVFRPEVRDFYNLEKMWSAERPAETHTVALKSRMAVSPRWGQTALAPEREELRMRVLLAAVGRLKEPEEREIVARYAKRFDQTGRALGLGPLIFVELTESRAVTAAARKDDEAQRLLKAAAAPTSKSRSTWTAAAYRARPSPSSSPSTATAASRRRHS